MTSPLEMALNIETVADPTGPLLSAVVKEHMQHVVLYFADGIQLCAAALIGLAAVQAAFRAMLIFFRREIEDHMLHVLFHNRG